MMAGNSDREDNFQVNLNNMGERSVFRDDFNGGRRRSSESSPLVPRAGQATSQLQSAINALSGGGGSNSNAPSSDPLRPAFNPAEPFRPRDAAPPTVMAPTAPPPERGYPPCAVQGADGLFWLEVGHYTPTSVHALRDK